MYILLSEHHNLCQLSIGRKTIRLITHLDQPDIHPPIDQLLLVPPFQPRLGPVPEGMEDNDFLLHCSIPNEM
jgi:hypothetical protein